MKHIEIRMMFIVLEKLGNQELRKPGTAALSILFLVSSIPGFLRNLFEATLSREEFA